MLMKAHYPTENITIAKVGLERPLSIEVALAHAWILPLIALPLLGMRFFSSYCTYIGYLLSSSLVVSYECQIFHKWVMSDLQLEWHHWRINNLMWMDNSNFSVQADGNDYQCWLLKIKILRCIGDLNVDQSFIASLLGEKRRKLWWSFSCCS